MIHSIQVFFLFSGDRAILRNDWNEVVDLILKPRPGGTLADLFIFLILLLSAEQKYCKWSSVFVALCSGERVPGSLQGGVGQDSGPRGGPEKAAQQALRGGAAAARPVHVRQEEHRHRLWTGRCFFLFVLKYSEEKDWKMTRHSTVVFGNRMNKMKRDVSTPLTSVFFRSPDPS